MLLVHPVSMNLVCDITQFHHMFSMDHEIEDTLIRAIAGCVGTLSLIGREASERSKLASRTLN
jgi:hypothetical protein